MLLYAQGTRRVACYFKRLLFRRRQRPKAELGVFGVADGIQASGRFSQASQYMRMSRLLRPPPVCFDLAVVVVRRGIIDNRSEANRTQASFAPAFNFVPVVLMELS